LGFDSFLTDDPNTKKNDGPRKEATVSGLAHPPKKDKDKKGSEIR